VTGPLVGSHATLQRVVGDEDTAVALGSGDVPVLATPRVLAWVEAATCACVVAALTDDETTVGTRVSLEHRRPTWVGAEVALHARLAAVEGRRLRFEVEASDVASGVLLAVGVVERVVVQRSRFAPPAAAPPNG
jgi:predicted thioesterase